MPSSVNEVYFENLQVHFEKTLVHFENPQVHFENPQVYFENPRPQVYLTSDEDGGSSCSSSGSEAGSENEEVRLRTRNLSWKTQVFKKLKSLPGGRRRRRSFKIFDGTKF